MRIAAQAPPVLLVFTRRWWSAIFQPLQPLLRRSTPERARRHRDGGFLSAQSRDEAQGGLADDFEAGEAEFVERVGGGVPVVVAARSGAVVEINDVHCGNAGLNERHVIIED